MKRIGHIVDIGSLDRRLTIQSYSAALNVYGEETLTWSTLATVYAGIDWVDSAESEDGEQEVTGTMLVATIRHRSDINTKMQVVLDSTTYDITGITEIGRKRFQKLYLKAVE